MKCLSCGREFTIDNLGEMYESVRFCPFCGSENLTISE